MFPNHLNKSHGMYIARLYEAPGLRRVASRKAPFTHFERLGARFALVRGETLIGIRGGGIRASEVGMTIGCNIVWLGTDHWFCHALRY